MYRSTSQNQDSDREWGSVTPKRRNSMPKRRNSLETFARDMVKSIRDHFHDEVEGNSSDKQGNNKKDNDQKVKPSEDTETITSSAHHQQRQQHQQQLSVMRQNSSDTLSTLDTTSTSLTALTVSASGNINSSGSNNINENTRPSKDISPVQYVMQEFNRIGLDKNQVIQSVATLSIDDLFEDTTPEQRAAYDNELIRAIRNQDIPALRKLHFEQGRTLQAANNFGESVLHMACRRGFLKVVQFLLEEAHVHLWLRDDTGRTPLHDACWTATPNFELVDYLVEKDCDLLLMKDKRGHLPFDYVRKKDWSLWVNQYFYEKNMTSIYPKRSMFVIAGSEEEDQVTGLESELAAIQVSQTTTSSQATSVTQDAAHIPQVVKVGSR
jgi:ankyrin repeat protein